MRLFTKAVSLFLCLCLLIPAIAPAAASDSEARVVFLSSAPDEDGLFTVSVTVYDADFDAFQFSFNYDGANVSPVSWSTGETTTDFNRFSEMGEDASIMNVYGYAPSDQDIINFVGICFPEDPSTISPDDYYISAGSEGVLVVSFRFAVLGEGDPEIALATSGTGKAYNASVPNGLEISKAGVSLSAEAVMNISSELGGSDTGSKTITDTENTNTENANYIMTKADRAKNTIILQIDNYAAAKDGALCHLYPGEKQITPYIKTGENGNGRTMVPVRFLAETMGATVLWDDATLTATITIGDDVLQMTIGSVVYTVNGETKTMDVPPETLYYNGESGYGRTMVPISFAAQALGKAVYWDNADRLVIITEQDLPWQDGRGAEAELKEDVLLVISPLLRDLIQ